MIQRRWNSYSHLFFQHIVQYWGMNENSWMLSTMGTVALLLALFGCWYSGVAGVTLENKGIEEAREHGSKRPFRILRPPAFVVLSLTVVVQLPQPNEVLYDIESSIGRVVSSKEDSFITQPLESGIGWTTIYPGLLSRGFQATINYHEEYCQLVTTLGAEKISIEGREVP